MKCPKCSVKMHKRMIDDIELDECRTCEGIWFDKDELRQVKDVSDSDLNWMDFDIWKHPEKFKASERKLDCPKCGIPMAVLNYADTEVEIDYCTECQGIWLDKGELEQIIASLEKEILSKSTNEYVKETVEEAKELLTRPESFISEWRDFKTILRFLQYRILSLQPRVHDTIVRFQHNPLNQ